MEKVLDMISINGGQIRFDACSSFSFILIKEFLCLVHYFNIWAMFVFGKHNHIHILELHKQNAMQASWLTST